MAHPTRIFKKPSDLEKAWKEYKDWLKKEAENWPMIQYVGKDGVKKTDYPILPYTLEGFKRYCRENYGDIHHYFENTQDRYNDFGGICSQVREEIREQQITGGMLGVYNASITQRLNGLADKSEVTEKREQPLFGPKE